MAKTIAQWMAGLVAAKNADTTIGTGGPSELSSTSLVAIWNLWLGIIAGALFDLGNMFDFHKAEVQGILATQTAHTLQWYVTKAKAFQYGDALPADTDVYPTVRPAGDPAFVVNFADAVETVNFVRVKVASGTPGALTALTTGQMTALNTYVNMIKDAGVRIQMTTGVGDNLQTGMIIYYDPLVLTDAGARIDGTEMTPVQDAINLFLASLPFNGVFDYNAFVAALQAVEGVIVAEVSVCQANFIGAPYVDIITAAPSEYIPDAGYLVLDSVYFLANIGYVAYS